MRREAIVEKNPKAPISETFRILRTNLQFMDTNKKMKTLLITSTYPGEGKSWVTSNLAITFAQADKRVILIDADMRKGRQYSIFEILPKPGLSNYLAQAEIDENGKSSEDINNYIQETEVKNLHVIPAGIVPPNPAELLVSPQMSSLLEQLKSMYDIVIIDGTPCEILTDSVILTRIVDTTVMVTAYKKTKKDALDRAIKNIQNVGGNIAGIVLNKTPRHLESQYYYRKPYEQKTSKKIIEFIKRKIEELNKKIKKSIAENEKEIEHETNEVQSIENIDENKNVVEEKTQDKSDDNTIKTENNGKDDKSTKNTNKKKKKQKSKKQDDNNNSEKNNIVLDEKSIEILHQINEYLDNERKKMDK